MPAQKPIILIALGGNALIQRGQKGTAEEQIENLGFPMRQIAELADKYRIIITHGNGPQVGNLLLQQESCEQVPKMPLEIIGAMTQGQIGYMIESSLDTALMERGIETEQPFCTLITFFNEEQAAKLPYNLVKTDKGYRRVVASPKPIAIVEHREIKKLIDMDFILICAGGGGIPVVRKGRKFSGVEAVIDKDLASSVLAREIKADLFVIATDTEGAAIHWGRSAQKLLRKVPLAEMENYVREKHFPPGSMGPKVQAILEFFQTTRKRGIICHLKDIQKAVAGEAGTEII
jgi:carbamate kinase